MEKPCVMLALTSRQLAASLEQALSGAALAVPCCCEEDARAFLAMRRPDVVICDAPGDGASLSQLQRLREVTRGAPLAMVSDGPMGAVADAEYLEADDVLERPFSEVRLRTCVATLTRLRRAEQQARAAAQAMSMRALAARDAFVEMFSALIEYRNQPHGHHLDRIRTGVRLLLTAYRALYPERALPQAQEDAIVQASVLHDIGAVGVPDSILLKPGRLTPEEYDIMKKHTAVGAASLSSPALPEGDLLIEAARAITASHHERWDGSGYPEGLRGEQIPLAARAVAVCDVLDALLGPRVYRREMSFDEALSSLVDGRGTLFDPDLIDALLSARQAFEELYRAMPPAQD